MVGLFRDFMEISMGIWELGIIIYNWNKSVYNWNIYNYNGIPIIDLIALICTIGILQQLPQHSWCFFGTPHCLVKTCLGPAQISAQKCEPFTSHQRLVQ